ncbi:MAG TPA: hypothetical protein PLZ95_09850 [Bryobacteraceae bacterium]|nr:hypothetical protein [Bryobacteraceae bacterium]
MTWPRALSVWVLLFAIAFANGALREVVLRGFLEELPAHQASCATGISLILLTIVLAGRKWPFLSDRQAWTTGFVWLLLTIAWEFVFGHFVMGHSWQRLIQDYAIWNGRLWLLVLVAILCAPALSRMVNRRKV